MNHALRSRILTFVIALAALSAARSPALAADIDGFPLCTAPGAQLSPVIVADGAGGFIAAWHDQRPTVALAGVCFAQRVNMTGTPLWAMDGVALSTTGDLGDPVAPAIAADGAGGAFVAYGGSSSQPRAQWVNAAGSPQWGADGVQITLAAPGMRDLAIVRDVNGAGGAIVVWRKVNGVGGNPDIHAQKINAAGATQWGADGVAVTSSSMNGETLPALLSDGAGGAIIVHLGSNGCRAYRLNSSGVSQWGTTILGTLTNNRRPAIVTDGAGGAVVGWAAGNTGIFVQRVTSVGNRAWSPTNAGVQLNTTGNQCTMIPYGAGGATVAWQDFQTGTNYNIFAQRVDGNGATQWIANGVPVCFVQGDQLAPMIVPDGGTGAILTWYDGRSFALGDDIYAQRINAAGASQWTPDGSGVCTVVGSQQHPTIAADAAGGAFVCWQDARSGTYDIYFHHLNASGTVLSVPGENLTTTMARAWPNPFHASVRLAFVLPVAATVRLEVFDIRGRSMRAYEHETLAAGERSLAWDGRASDGTPAGPGIYYLRVTGPGIALSRRVVRLE